MSVDQINAQADWYATEAMALGERTRKAKREVLAMAVFLLFNVVVGVYLLSQIIKVEG